MFIFEAGLLCLDLSEVAVSSFTDEQVIPPPVLNDTGQAALTRVRGTYVTCRQPVCAGSLWQSAV